MMNQAFKLRKKYINLVFYVEISVIKSLFLSYFPYSAYNFAAQILKLKFFFNTINLKGKVNKITDTSTLENTFTYPT